MNPLAKGGLTQVSVTCNNDCMENKIQGKKYVCVDGCHYGWFAIIQNGESGFQTAKYEKITDLWKANKDAELILIDIPIGLRENITNPRLCDFEARKLLGERINSVFFAPCRNALNASCHKAASKINQDETGRGLSIQAWNICKKIKEVDDFLRSNNTALLLIKETHPELCFAMLNDGNPMHFSKKHSEGYEERLEMLRKLCKTTDEVVGKAKDCFKRKDVAKDDILDAFVLAVTASFGKENLKTIPEKPEFDSRGLPMQMLYYLKED